jgi:hypothetical protein
MTGWSLIVILLIVAVVVVVVVVVRAIAKRMNDQPQLAAKRNQTQVEAQALAMQQWQASYALANPGQPVPAPPAMMVPGFGAGDRTNTLAILALVFGVLGGYLAIIFGHIALSQIKRTGERGGGMATAGLILGYLWLAVTVVFVIVVVVRATSGQ